MNKHNPIITTDNYKIYQDHEIPTNYLLEFSYVNRSLINSLVKTRLLKGSTITNNYKSLQFKASSVMTYKQLTNKLRLNDLTKIIISLVTQLDYLINNESKCFLGYNIEDLIIINDTTYIYLGSDYLQDIKNETILVSAPFTQTEFFLSPELKQIKELPSYIHFKTCYYSLACLLMTLYKGEAEEVSEANTKNFLPSLKRIENTKLYYFLLRALTEEPTKRSLIYI